VEIGFDQRQDVMNLVSQNEKYKDVYCKKDLAGNDRIVVCKKR
jgi:methylase of polypeptide subunit release factors